MQLSVFPFTEIIEGRTELHQHQITMLYAPSGVHDRARLKVVMGDTDANVSILESFRLASKTLNLTAASKFMTSQRVA